MTKHTEMPNDPHLGEPGRVDRYLPWSDDVPASCRLASGRVCLTRLTWSIGITVGS